MNVMQRLLDDQQCRNEQLARIYEEQNRIWAEMVRTVQKRRAGANMADDLDGIGVNSVRWVLGIDKNA